MMKYYSQNQQDHFLDYFFDEKKIGVFVDIGAHDGVTFSNSYFFEKHRNWTGLCVEPIPEVFQKLEKNRNCIKANFCIGTKDGAEKFLRIRGYSEMLSGIYANYEERHLKRIEEELKTFDGEQELIDVQSIPLAKLLAEHQLSEVDFLSLDVEGSEMEVLKSIDYNACTFGIILFENNYEDPNIRDFLVQKGFKFLRRIGKDEAFYNQQIFGLKARIKAKMYRFLTK